MKQVSDNIMELFAKSRKSQQIFSDFIGVSQNTCSNWIRGIHNPNSAFIPRIAEFFGVPIERLFEGVE